MLEGKSTSAVYMLARDGARRADGAHEPRDDRLRSRARDLDPARPLADAACPRARRPLARVRRAVPALRAGLADLRRRPRGGRAPGGPARLVGPGVAAGDRAGHRHPVVAVAGLLAPGRPPGAVARRPGQPRHDDRVRRAQPAPLMSPLPLDEALEAYIEAHTTPPEAHLASLAAETRESLSAPQMLTGTVEGRFLEALVWASRPQLVLELGTYSGYSALSMAPALPPGVRIVTCELDPDRADFAQRHIDASPHADRIELRRGSALDTIGGRDAPLDLVFIDADKPNYVNYYEAVVPKLAERGLIVADNTLWSGAGGGGGGRAGSTPPRRAFNDRVRDDERVACVMLSVRDGITLAWRRG